jgi:hypothetical protein
MFVAEFEDGPLVNATHMFMGADAPLHDLYFVTIPGAGVPMLVGYTGMEPEHPSEAMRYVLLATELMGNPVGHYVLMSDAQP